jgi:hypothetical protein
MTRTEKYDKILLGAISGFLLPFLAGLLVFIFSTATQTLPGYIKRIIEADILTHAISLCVFPNIVIFLIFNRLDMLKAARGVLGITFFWAVLVFAVKFLL